MHNGEKEKPKNVLDMNGGQLKTMLTEIWLFIGFFSFFLFFFFLNFIFSFSFFFAIARARGVER